MVKSEGMQFSFLANQVNTGQKLMSWGIVMQNSHISLFLINALKMMFVKAEKRKVDRCKNADDSMFVKRSRTVSISVM